MAKNDSTAPENDFESEGGALVPEPTTAQEVDAPAQADVNPPEESSVPVEAASDVVQEPVEVLPDPEFEAEGDVYVSVAYVPEEYRVSDTDDRYKFEGAVTVDPDFAAQLADSAAFVTQAQLDEREAARAEEASA